MEPPKDSNAHFFSNWGRYTSRYIGEYLKEQVELLDTNSKGWTHFNDENPDDMKLLEKLFKEVPLRLIAEAVGTKLENLKMEPEGKTESILHIFTTEELTAELLKRKAEGKTDVEIKKEPVIKKRKESDSEDEQEEQPKKKGKCSIPYFSNLGSKKERIVQQELFKFFENKTFDGETNICIDDFLVLFQTWSGNNVNSYPDIFKNENPNAKEKKKVKEFLTKYMGLNVGRYRPTKDPSSQKLCIKGYDLFGKI
jgi:hypothetical protein